MSKDCLEYDCEIPHHDFDTIKISLQYRNSTDDVIVDLEVPDGGGNLDAPSRVSITASELREIMFITNKYIDARGVMETDDRKAFDLSQHIGATA